MTPADGGVLTGTPVPVTTVLEEVLPRLLDDPSAIGVIDETGAVVGLVDRHSVAALLHSEGDR